MQERVDVAIVGGGLAGSALAALLHRAGVCVALCDPRDSYPPDFRAEKLSARQAAQLRRLGLSACLGVCTAIETLEVARFGRIVERRPNRELAFDYADLVNAIRAAVPASAIRIGRVAAVGTPSDARRVVRLGDGRTIEAGLVVMATGLARAVIDDLGLARRVVEPDHCLAIGFDVALRRHGACRRALTYHGERLVDRSAYLTLFPLGARLRANLFVYHGHGEAWVSHFRARPAESLRELMPGLAPILGEFEVASRVVLRPIALHVTDQPTRDGLVLVGDAFATTCPTGGTGIDKVLTDIERLAALVPGWIAAGDTGAAAVARFYEDPVKRACDAEARRMIAYARAMALDPGLAWTARRWRNFLVQSGRGWLRRLSHGGAEAAAGR